MLKLAKFVSAYPLKRFNKGQIILVQGEEPKSSYFIKKGAVKTYNLTADGEEKPISFDVTGEIFPAGWTYYKQAVAQYYYEAFVDSELYVFPREEFQEFVKASPDALHEVMDYFVGRYLNYQMRVNALEQSKASLKVLHTIHFLALRFGADIKPHVVRINLPFTQQDLANFMGLTRETTSIELKKLQDQKILSYNKQRYVIHTDRLNRLLDEDYEDGKIINQASLVIV